MEIDSKEPKSVTYYHDTKVSPSISVCDNIQITKKLKLLYQFPTSLICHKPSKTHNVKSSCFPSSDQHFNIGSCYYLMSPVPVVTFNKINSNDVSLFKSPLLTGLRQRLQGVLTKKRLHDCNGHLQYIFELFFKHTWINIFGYLLEKTNLLLRLEN